MLETLPGKVRSKIAVAPNGCWEWTGEIINGGYGRFKLQQHGVRHSYMAHRHTYTLLRGEIPAGLQIDHLCRNRKCCNPDHLEPVTPRVNQHRGVGFSGRNAAKTHCPRGHEYTPENTYVPPKNPRRMCRTCGSAEGRRQRRSKSC